MVSDGGSGAKVGATTGTVSFTGAKAFGTYSIKIKAEYTDSTSGSAPWTYSCEKTLTLTSQR